MEFLKKKYMFNNHKVMKLKENKIKFIAYTKHSTDLSKLQALGIVGLTTISLIMALRKVRVNLHSMSKRRMKNSSLYVFMLMT